jgi:hypothetical protein
MNKLIRKLCNEKVTLFMPDGCRFHCRCFRRSNISRKGKAGEITAVQDIFVIYLNMKIPLDTLLKTPAGEILHLQSVRPIVDMEGRIIALRCATV